MKGSQFAFLLSPYQNTRLNFQRRSSEQSVSDLRTVASLPRDEQAFRVERRPPLSMAVEGMGSGHGAERCAGSWDLPSLTQDSKSAGDRSCRDLGGYTAGPTQGSICWCLAKVPWTHSRQWISWFNSAQRTAGSVNIPASIKTIVVRNAPPCTTWVSLWALALPTNSGQSSLVLPSTHLWNAGNSPSHRGILPRIKHSEQRATNKEGSITPKKNTIMH